MLISEKGLSMPGPQPLSWVTAIELKNNNTITLHVRVDGFGPGTPVEISGYATQPNGAVATFYDIQKMPDTAGAAIMDVINVRAASPNKFQSKLPFTVVARAADVWISTLDDDGMQEHAVGIEAGWNSAQNDYRSALYTDKQGSPAGQSSSSGKAWPS
jgi:hypothetical protein